MMNKLLWDLINTGKIASFIDDITIETETKEEHDKIVKEVVKWLAENNLYVKLEKYKWKIRKVGFLEVIIGSKRIKIEEEKIKEIQNWPTLQEAKDIQKFLELANYYYQFIKDFTIIARPLYDIVKKDKKWEWIER